MTRRKPDPIAEAMSLAFRANAAEAKLAVILRQVERAARGKPHRSATRAARKLLRQLTEE